MPTASLIRTLLLPELSLVSYRHIPSGRVIEVVAAKERQREFCPKCATPSEVGYDRRSVRLKDEGLRGFQVRLTVHKRRLWCGPCRKPFTEPLRGVRKGFQHTERFGRAALRACERYVDLSHVRRDFRCSAGWLYSALYRHLDLEHRKRRRDWPEVVGLDEHCFGRRKPLCPRDFVSMVVDVRGHRLFELVDGRTIQQLETSLAHIQGAENVRLVALDMSDGYRSFARRKFPNARLVADKFHVLRLLNPALTQRRVEVTGDRRSMAIRRLLLRNGHSLDFWNKLEVQRFLEAHPALREVYLAKEALHRFYRTQGIDRATHAFDNLLARLKASTLPELATLRRTLARWRSEVLAYFDTGLTNAITEGFNLKAKLVKRRAFGYRSFRNYRLRLLNACAS
jgi:transposase